MQLACIQCLNAGSLQEKLLRQARQLYLLPFFTNLWVDKASKVSNGTLCVGGGFELLVMGSARQVNNNCG